MGKGSGGALGAMIDQFIHPLLYAGNAAIFLIGLAIMAVGGWLIVGNEQAAATAAIGIFALGAFSMYLAGISLLGLLKKSGIILTVVAMLLLAMVVAFFGAIIVSFALGFQLPSVRDIVKDNWHEGCLDPANDKSGCMQADLVAENVCFQRVGAPFCP
eukprot:SAG22_NODE_5323_length_1037_cov_0.925373_1_plen_157_part_01